MAAFKYRISLSADQINYLLTVLSLDTCEKYQALRSSVYKQLSVTKAKIGVGATAPAFATVGRQSLEDKLGVSEDPVDYKKSAYDLWRQNPAACPPNVLKLANLYRYENDLMSPEEEMEYESLT